MTGGFKTYAFCGKIRNMVGNIFIGTLKTDD